jgi:capsular polysaccharide biosynthesis protein
MSNLFSVAAMLRHSRKLYRGHLKNFLIFRILKYVMLRIYFRYPLFFLKLSRLFVIETRTLKLISMTEYTRKEKISVVYVRSSINTTIHGPQFIAKQPSEVVDKVVSLIEPSITIASVPNVMVMGGTDLLLTNKYAIYPDIQEPRRDVIPAEYHGVAKVNAETGSITLGVQREPRHFKFAITMLGNCTGNYAHWLTETLPKLILIDEHEEFINYPILIDEGIHPNILSSISLLNKLKREIIEISKWEAIFVESLINVSPPGYAPPESRQYYEKRIFPKPKSDFFNFSRFALEKVRLAAWDASTSIQASDLGKKLYLCRPKRFTGNGRLVVNIDKVEEQISKYGFTEVNPAEMSFAEQIEVFKNAEFIVSPIGAALVNAVFLPPKSRILVLSPYHENANYYYFSNLMGALEHNMYYLIGPQVDSTGSKDHIVHKNYSIDLDDLQTALEQLTQ